MNILISTGDLSGELYGLEILKGLKKIFPEAEFFSLTKGILAEAGAIPISSVSNVRAIGITEILPHIKSLWNLFKSLKQFFRNSSPHTVILIDFPDMNLNVVARMAKARGAKVLYFIPPQVWAWRASRIKLLKRLVDELIVIFPFEEVFYKKAGIDNVVYFGHPLVDKMPAKTGSSLNTKDGLIVGLFPGSRPSEWKHHIPIINKVVGKLKTLYPKLRFLMAVAPGIEEIAYNSNLDPGIELVYGSISESSTKLVLERSHLALAAAGTVTLEALLYEVPMVVFYKVSPVSSFIIKMSLKTSFGALPNIIAGEKIVPEFIEFIKHFEAEDIIKAVIYLFKDGNYPFSELEIQRKALAKIKEKLGTPPVMQRIVDYIASFIQKEKDF